MAVALDVTGEKYGRLTAIRKAKSRKRTVYWLFKCECGKEKEISLYTVRHGGVKSCGCQLIDSATKHGKRHTPEYKVWRGLIDRCTNPKAKYFERYGGRGIKVCQRWVTSFIYFYSDMGERPTNKHQIDRVDNNGDYSPENCKWVTQSENNRNRKGCYYWVIDDIKFDSIHDAADHAGVCHSTINKRVNGHKKRGKWIPPFPNYKKIPKY